MDGDVITRIRQHKDYRAHVHTAGNPGRGELDDHQEIAYKPIMEALLEVGYQGYVGHGEFILHVATSLEGLRLEAVRLCDDLNRHTAGRVGCQLPTGLDPPTRTTPASIPRMPDQSRS